MKNIVLKLTQDQLLVILGLLGQTKEEQSNKINETLLANVQLPLLEDKTAPNESFRIYDALVTKLEKLNPHFEEIIDIRDTKK